MNSRNTLQKIKRKKHYIKDNIGKENHNHMYYNYIKRIITKIMGESSVSDRWHISIRNLLFFISI